MPFPLLIWHMLLQISRVRLRIARDLLHHRTEIPPQPLQEMLAIMPHGVLLANPIVFVGEIVALALLGRQAQPVHILVDADAHLIPHDTLPPPDGLNPQRPDVIQSLRFQRPHRLLNTIHHLQTLIIQQNRLPTRRQALKIPHPQRLLTESNSIILSHYFFHFKDYPPKYSPPKASSRPKAHA